MRNITKIEYKIIYEYQFLKARQTLLNNMHNVYPYYNGLNCRQEIDKIGFIFIDGKIEPYIQLQYRKYLIGSYDLSKTEDNIDYSKQYMTWITLLKYKKYDINFNSISNFVFIFKLLESFVLRINDR